MRRTVTNSHLVAIGAAFASTSVAACVGLLDIERLPVDDGVDGTALDGTPGSSSGDSDSTDGGSSGMVDGSNSDAAANRHLVWAGGYNGFDDAGDFIPSDSVYLARVNGDGTIGSWREGPKLPPSQRTDAVFVTANRVHVLLDQARIATSVFDGTDLSPFIVDAMRVPAAVGTIRCPVVYGNRVFLPRMDGAVLMHTPIGASGLGVWTQESVGNAQLQRAAMGLIGSTMVAVDDRGSIFSSSVGTIPPSAWRTELIAPPDSGATFPTGAIYDYYSPILEHKNRIYLIGTLQPGPVTANRVFFAPPGPPTSALTWTRTESFPLDRHGHSAVVIDDQIYVAGGMSSADELYANVSRTKILSDGKLEPWLDVNQPLPKPQAGPCQLAVLPR